MRSLISSLFPLSLFLPVSVFGQSSAQPSRNPAPAKDVRLVAKDGQVAIPKLALYLNSPALDTRIEVVKQLTELGGKDSLDPLITASHDADPEMQMRSIDGLVNFYLPGYVRQGPAASVARVGASIKAKFSDTNDQVIDGFVTVRPEVIERSENWPEAATAWMCGPAPAARWEFCGAGGATRPARRAADERQRSHV